MSEIYRLPIARKKIAQPPAKPLLPVIHTAKRLLLDGESVEQLHGVIGGYQTNLECATTAEVSLINGQAACYLWDTDTHLPGCAVEGNHCNIHSSTLEGPELYPNEENTQLQLTARWRLVWDTAAYDAELGMITLVESQRYITLQNGEQITVSDSRAAEAPLLYLDGKDDSEFIKRVGEQQQGAKQAYEHALTISQTIPDSVAGELVETVTVLEQYHSYFMQRPSDAEVDTIWVPLVAPISWGWSIRVGRRTDGPWCIIRRKLIMPTVGHDGLVLPLWQANTLSYSNQALI